MRRHLALLLLALLLPWVGEARGADDPRADADIGERPGFWGRLGRLFSPSPALPGRVELHRRQSAYFDIVVEQDADDLRHLVFLPNHGSQTIIDPSDPTRPVSAYIPYMFLALPALGRPPTRALFIGLGGGIMPMMLRQRHPELAIDIVEIDPAVTEIAEDFFAFRRDPRLTVHHGDGRVFLRRNEIRYDLIFLDAYNAEAIPFHLTTQEFYGLMGRRLAPGGVIAVNSAELLRQDFNACEIRTIRAALPHLAVYRNAAGTNYIFLAAAENPLDPAAMAGAAAALDRREGDGPLRLADIVGTRLEEAELSRLTDGAAILSDDFAPVDHLDGQP
jgi:spermidine synthase